MQTLGQQHIHHKADGLKRLGTDCLPYGTILTEILNLQMKDYCTKLAAVEQTIAGRNRAQLSHPLKELMDTFMALPLYRLYIGVPWAVGSDLFWKLFEVRKDTSMSKQALKAQDKFLQKYVLARGNFLWPNSLLTDFGTPLSAASA